MKNHLRSFTHTFHLFLLLLPFSQVIGQKATYALTEKENAFVMIQLREKSKESPTDLNEPDVLAVVHQIKMINTKLGYEEFEKKMASFTLDTLGHKVSYLTIRNFNDFTSAETYSRALSNELPDSVYGKIKAPFPISQSDYKRCVAVKDFKSYYKYYSKNRK